MEEGWKEGRIGHSKRSRGGQSAQQGGASGKHFAVVFDSIYIRDHRRSNRLGKNYSSSRGFMLHNLQKQPYGCL